MDIMYYIGLDVHKKTQTIVRLAGTLRCLLDRKHDFLEIVQIVDLSEGIESQ